MFDSISDFEILPANFSIFRKDRGTRGGGVLIAVDASIPCSVVSSPSNLEVITVKIGLNTPILLCTVYVPPNSSDSYQISLMAYLTELLPMYEHAIILGDFNLPDINWSSLSGTSSFSKQFCDFIFDSNLTQLVESPTHIKGNILDIVLTKTNIVHDVYVDMSDYSITSDHHIVTFKMDLSVQRYRKHTSRYVFDYKNADMNNFLSYMLDCDFSDCLQSDNIEFIWSYIKSCIYTAMNMYIPRVKRRWHKFPCWFTPDIKHHLNCLNTLKRKSKICPTDHNISKWKSSMKILQDKITSAKKRYETHLIKTLAYSNSSKVFKYINSITGNDTFPSNITFESSTATSDYGKATLFNDYFFSVFTQSSYVLPPVDELPKPDASLSDIVISESDVFNALTSLDSNKAMGIDRIGPHILKHCALALCQPFHHLFSLCLSKHYIPEEWRIHLIIPIFKSGDRSAVKNYRPISLLCTISKVLERIVFAHIIDFVSNSISPMQFGFLQNHSTLQQLLVFLRDIYNSFTHNTPTDVLYLDFKKAFDSVSHNELLFKLWRFGITGNLWKWFKAYLSHRHQCVSLNNSTSNTLPVISGVPQGSILGPVLFLIFVNDLPPTVSSSSLYLFADDTKCLSHINNLGDSLSLQDDLNLLTSWSNHWKLIFNTLKCAVLRFSPSLSISAPSPTYYISGHPVLQREFHKDLGIVMSHDLSWDNHYKYILSNAYKMLGLLRRTFPKVDCVQAKKALYLSLVRSKLTYCSPIWRPHFLKDIQSTVEPLNKGHFGSRGFVLFSEVVLWWEVQANRSFIDVIYLDNMF